MNPSQILLPRRKLLSYSFFGASMAGLLPSLLLAQSETGVSRQIEDALASAKTLPDNPFASFFPYGVYLGYALNPMDRIAPGERDSPA